MLARRLGIAVARVVAGVVLGPAGLLVAALIILADGVLVAGLAIVTVVHAHPPIGALGFAPQNSWVPSIPIRCTSTMFNTIDFAVAVPTPTGPPDAL